MSNKSFIENHPLELCLPSKESKALRKILKEANQNYVLECKETLGVKPDGVQYYNFEIHCPTTSFANAYWHFGLLYAKHVLPILESRFKAKKPK